VQIRIEGYDLPGASCGPGPDYPDGDHNVHVAVQRRNKPGELLGMVRGDVPVVEWTLECSTAETSSGFDVKGPYVQGPPGGRFVYLSWGVFGGAGEFTMFRRAKLMLDGVPTDVVRAAVAGGVLVGRLGLTDEQGGPRCAAVRPPLIAWSADT
jgi:Family of unknown function (DUF5990)